MAAFPRRTFGTTGNEIVPTSRNFTFGDFPVKEYRSISGFVAKRVFGNRAFNYRLQLTFANVKQDVVAAIFDHYQGQGGTLEGFSIPNNLFSGYNDTIRSRMKDPRGVEWFYEASPEVESISTALSTISVSFVGQLSY
jgi:hypothetical protein